MLPTIRSQGIARSFIVAQSNPCSLRFGVGSGTTTSMRPVPATRNAVSPDVDAVTDAVLTASRLLMSISARSIAAVDDTITIPQFRLLVVLHARGPVKLTAIADALMVNPSTATRM